MPQGRIVGFTCGCFDLLHPGHLRSVQMARERCDYLVVAVNSDRSVRERKGEGRPIHSLKRRAEALRALRWVDQVNAFDDEAALHRMIELIRPHIIFKGAEYIGQPIIGSDIAPVCYLPMMKDYSTTNEIAKRGRLA